MSANLYSHQSENVRKTWLLMAVFLAIIVGLAWFLSYYYNDPGILYIGLIFSMVMNIGSFWFSDKIVLSIAGARPVNRAEYFDLYNAVENLAIMAGLPMPRVYVMDDPAPNAFATGRDKNHAVVAVTTGLLAILNKTELEGVVSHELAHIGNRDILLQTVVVVLVGFITLIADIFWRSNFHKSDDKKSGGVLLIIGIVLMILSPIIASLIQLAISRKREFLADATGAMLTRYPDGLASALEKISASAQPMRRANHATAHLFISNPFASKPGAKVSWLQKMFMTHPPVEERVAALRGVSVESVMRQ